MLTMFTPRLGEEEWSPSVDYDDILFLYDGRNGGETLNPSTIDTEDSTGYTLARLGGSTGFQVIADAEAGHPDFFDDSTYAHFMEAPSTSDVIYTTTGFPALGTQSWCIAFWIYPMASHSDYNGIIWTLDRGSSANGLEISINGAGRNTYLNIWESNSITTSVSATGSNLAFNSWYFVVWEYDASTGYIRCWVDGTRYANSSGHSLDIPLGNMANNSLVFGGQLSNRSVFDSEWAIHEVMIHSGVVYGDRATIPVQDTAWPRS